MSLSKKITLIIALLIFAMGILGASIWQTAAQTTDEGNVLLIEGDETAGSVPGQATEETGKVDYDLHWGGTLYPGILPDHLLYPLKMIRDRIWLFLTTDPLKKAELYLKFADKRLLAAETLINANKIDLGISTLTKAEKYLEQAVNQEKLAKEASKETNELLERLSRATLKHEEVILKFEEKIPNTTRPAYDSALQYARQGHQRVMERLGQ